MMSPSYFDCFFFCCCCYFIHTHTHVRIYLFILLCFWHLNVMCQSTLSNPKPSFNTKYIVKSFFYLFFAPLSGSKCNAIKCCNIYSLSWLMTLSICCNIFTAPLSSLSSLLIHIDIFEILRSDNSVSISIANSFSLSIYLCLPSFFPFSQFFFIRRVQWFHCNWNWIIYMCINWTAAATATKLVGHRYLI